jgi:hypothetical protein
MAGNRRYRDGFRPRIAAAMISNAMCGPKPSLGQQFPATRRGAEPCPGPAPAGRCRCQGGLGWHRLRAVIRTNRWLLPTVLIILVAGALIGAALH